MKTIWAVNIFVTIYMLLGLFTDVFGQDVTPPTVEGAGFYHTIEFVYSQSMEDDVLNVLNYEMFNSSLMLVDILSVSRVDTHKVNIVVPVLPYKISYVIRVTNVHNIKGDIIEDKNSAWVFFEGYDSTETKPYLIVK